MGTGPRQVALRKDGTTFPAEISLSPVATATGTFTLTVIRDVTKARRLADLADLARRQRRALPRKARPPHAGPQPQGTRSKTAHTPCWPELRVAVILAAQCPARGCRVNAVRRLPASRPTPCIDPASRPGRWRMIRTTRKPDGQLSAYPRWFIHTETWAGCRAANKAAAASVDAATATGELTDSTRVASSTSPAYTPTSSPVTIA